MGVFWQDTLGKDYLIRRVLVSLNVVTVFRNVPFGLAPGLGLSTFLVYGLVLGQGLSMTEAFTSVSEIFDANEDFRSNVISSVLIVLHLRLVPVVFECDRYLEIRHEMHSKLSEIRNNCWYGDADCSCRNDFRRVHCCQQGDSRGIRKSREL